MKRIEKIIASEKISELNAAFETNWSGWMTILDAKGRGKGEKPMVEAQRGTALLLAEFSVRANVELVVEDLSKRLSKRY